MAENKEENKRKFEGIWIPAEIWLSKDLTIQEKVFFVEIKSLDNKKGCFASNEYFSNFFGLSKVRVSEVISSLVFKGYIISDINKADGNKRILKVNKRKVSSIKPSANSLLKPSLRGSKPNLKEANKEDFTSESNPVSNSFSSPVEESKSVVTDTHPLQAFENSDFSTSEKPNNCESENLVSLKEKSTEKKTNSGGARENVGKSVSEVEKLKITTRPKGSF